MSIDEKRLRQLVDVFLEENKKLNLSAFRTPEHCWTGNVLDSLAFLQAFDVLPELRSIKNFCDIGTGGGFPLLPLALCLPDASCVGMDSTAKKLVAVSHIVEGMGMKNVRLLTGRFEDFGQDPAFRSSFDLVTARAVATLPVLLEYAVPLLKVGGIAAFWKSDKIADELGSTATAQKLLDAPFLRTFEYSLGESWGTRTIVFFKKTKETSSDYPRKTGIPKMEPL